MPGKLVPVCLVASLCFASPAAGLPAAPIAPFAKGVRLLGALDLTASQRAEIRAILAGRSEALDALLAREKAARAGLVDAIRRPQVKEAEVRAAAGLVAEVDADLAVERARIWSEVSAVLTPAQRAALDKGIDELRDAALDAMGALRAIVLGLLS